MRKLHDQQLEAYMEVKGSGSPHAWLLATLHSALLREAFIDRTTQVRIPRSLARSPEADVLCETLLDTAQPLLEALRDTLLYCVDKAVSFQYFDASAHACAALLEPHLPLEYMGTHELFGEPAPSPAHMRRAPLVDDIERCTLEGRRHPCPPTSAPETDPELETQPPQTTQ